MPRDLVAVLRDQRRDARQAACTYRRARRRELRSHMQRLDEYRLIYHEVIKTHVGKAMAGIERDRLMILGFRDVKLAKNVFPANGVHLVCHADIASMLKAHAQEFRLRVRKEVARRFVGLLVLPYVETWQDCNELMLENNLLERKIDSDIRDLKGKCTQQRILHRKILRCMNLY